VGFSLEGQKLNAGGHSELLLLRFRNCTPTYTYLESLHCDYNNGILSAIAFMQGLQDYTEKCLFEQEEWKVDNWAEIRRNHNIKYPKDDDTAIPQSWRAINEPRHGLPHTIKESRPLGHELK
jgi:hypothetical protein